MSTSKAVRETVIRKAGPAVLVTMLAVCAPLAFASAEDAPSSGAATVMSAELLEGAAVGTAAEGLHVHGDVRAAAGEASETVFAGLFRVDTGAAQSIAPASALEAAGIVPAGVTDYERADGTVEQVPFGLVRIEFLGEMREGRILFGPEDVEPAIGTDALEAVGIGVDLETRTLTRAAAGQ